MKIDFDLFKESFSQSAIPSWTCPNCMSATMIVDRKSITINEAEQSKLLKEFLSPDEGYGRFVGQLKCASYNCQEITYFSGDCHKENDGVEINDDPDGGGQYETWDWFITPKFFSAPIWVFTLHEYYPKKVNELIGQAFGLMWFDAPACANRIRNALERLLDHKKVKPNVNLQRRINDFKKTNPDAGHYVEAVKWIGNVGSHANDIKLKRENLLDAFDMLQHVLDTLYDKHPSKLKKKADEVIKRKGKPIKKRVPKPRFI